MTDTQETERNHEVRNIVNQRRQGCYLRVHSEGRQVPVWSDYFYEFQRDHCYPERPTDQGSGNSSWCDNIHD